VEFCIKELRDADLRAIIEIERDCFPDPWPITWFREAIRTRDVALGVWFETELAGYLIACPEDDSMHIGNLAVAAGYRRRGGAAALIGEFLGRLSGSPFTRIYLEVRESNEAAIRLYRRFGFEVTGREKDYYQGSEDALIMTVERNGLV